MQTFRLAEALAEQLACIPGAITKTMTRSKTPLFSTGARADYVYIVRSGLLMLARDPEMHLTQVVGAGSIIGYEALAGESVYHHTANVVEAGVVIAVPAEAVLAWCNADATRWRKILLAFVAQHALLERKLEHLCRSDVRRRLLYFLKEIGELTTTDPDEYLTIRLTQRDLVRYIGASRETTSTTLNPLEREGLVSLGRKCIVLS